jgi:hypothetical protein
VKAQLWFALGALMSAGLVGCEDPIVGDWEGSNGCGDAEFTIEDNELTGDGSFQVPDTTGSCITCDFDVEFDDPEDGSYDGTVELSNCNCGGATKLDVECDIDDDSLDCTLECVGDQDFDRKD